MGLLTESYRNYLTTNEAKRKEQEEINKALFTSGLKMVTEAVQMGKAPSEAIGQFILNAKSGKIGLLPQSGVVPGTGEFTDGQVVQPANMGLIPGRGDITPEQFSPETGKFNFEPPDYQRPDDESRLMPNPTVKTQKIDYRGEPVYQWNAKTNKYEEIPESRGVSHTQFIGKPTSNLFMTATGETSTSKPFSPKAQPKVTQSPQEKADMKWAENVMKPENEFISTDEQKETAINILNRGRKSNLWRKIVKPGAIQKGGWFGEDKQGLDIITYEQNTDEDDGQPEPVSGQPKTGAAARVPTPTGTVQTKTRRQNPNTKEWWVFKGGKWQKE